MRKYIYLLAIVCLFIGAGCGKTTTPPSSNAIGKATLSFPAKDAVCTTGIILSPTQSIINFSWGAAANTDVYLIGVKNLLTQAIHYKKTTSPNLTDTLLRNTPYSWFVVSKSQKIADTVKSDVWKFYNAGAAIVDYIPFPADVVSPAIGKIVIAYPSYISLVWQGSSPDNDIASYDVYLGTTTTPVLYRANVTTMYLNDIPVTSGTYYWKIITKDARNNTSESGIFMFVVY